MIEHIADHEERAIELLPLTHSLRDGRKGLVRALGGVAQALEDKIYAAAMGQVFDLAIGRALDRWGWLAGVPRGGLEDRWYKPLIRVAFASKRMTGNTDDMINLWKAAADTNDVEFFRYPHKTVVLLAWVDDWRPEPYMRRVAEVVRRGCPIGSVVLVESLRQFVGDPTRTRSPLPADPLGGATLAKVW